MMTLKKNINSRNHIILFIVFTVMLAVITSNSYAYHSIRVGKNVEPASGTRASGCALYQRPDGSIDNETMSCYLFNDGNCYIKTFALVGIPKPPYLNWSIPLDSGGNQVDCGYRNVSESNNIFQRLVQNNIISGNSPKTPASFRYAGVIWNTSICRGAGAKLHAIMVNEGTDYYGANNYGCNNTFFGNGELNIPSLGCGTEGDYIHCYHIRENDCLKRIYAVNGSLVSAESVANCSFRDKDLSGDIYSSLDLFRYGVDPKHATPTISSYHPFKYGSLQPQLLLSSSFSDTYSQILPLATDTYDTGRAIGCIPHPDDPQNKYKCYSLNDYHCDSIEVSKSGIAIPGSTVAIPNCGYWAYISETQAIYDSLSIARVGSPPVAVHSDDFFNTRFTTTYSYNNFYNFYYADVRDRHIVHIDLIATRQVDGFSRTVALFNNPNGESPLRALGCRTIDGEPHYIQCTAFYTQDCSTSKYAKNGAADPGGWQPIDECGYDTFPQNTLMLYNKLNKNDINQAKILYGDPPDIARSVFTLDGPTNQDGYYFFIDGTKQDNTKGTRAIGCKPKLPNANSFLELECISFSQDKCSTYTYSAYGALTNTSTNYSCGYNNYEFAHQLWEQLDSGFRLGTAPTNDFVNFQAYYNSSSKKHILNIGDVPNYLQSDLALGCKIINDNALCLKVNADGSTTQLTDCVQCIGFNVSSCVFQEFTRQGYPLRGNYQNTNCGYTNFSEDNNDVVDLFNSLGPETPDSALTVSGTSPQLLLISTEQVDNRYILKVNGNQVLDAEKGVGCANSPTNQSYITCYKFDQAKCSWIEIWKSGFIKAGLASARSGDCGYAYYGLSTLLDGILANLNPAQTLMADLNASADYVAIYDENYLDTAVPPNYFRKYYLRIAGYQDLSYVATRAIGCSSENVINGVAQRECIAFDQFNCYKRLYSKTGLAIDSYWQIKQENCGYAYKSTAASLYDSLDPSVRAGTHPNDAPSGIQGKEIILNDANKYIISLYGVDLMDAIFINAAGCKNPGVDIDPNDPQHNEKVECLGFNASELFRRQFTLGGVSLTPWLRVQHLDCDPQHLEENNCNYESEYTKKQYCKMNQTTVAQQSPPLNVDCSQY